MKPDVFAVTHTFIIGDLGTIVAITLAASAVSGIGSLLSAVTAFLKRKKGTDIAITLSDGSKVKFDKTMSAQEVTQKLSDVAAKVHGALDVPNANRMN